jgi:hypothetical protein
MATARNTLVGACQPGCGWQGRLTAGRKARMRSAFDIAWAQELPAEPVTVGDVTVTPRSRALVVRLPRGGFVWNRPGTVLVERAGQVRRIKVWDVTRILQLGSLGLGLAIALAVPFRSSRRTEVAR